MRMTKKNAVIGGKEKPCRRPTLKSMSGEYALLSGYLGKLVRCQSVSHEGHEHI